MSYTPRYTRRNYVNNQAPSINAENLNAIEDAIVSLEANAQSYSSKVDTLQNTSATKTELNIAKRELSEDIAFANRAIADEIEARENADAEIKKEIAKVANSNLQTSSDVLDFAMDGNIQSARFEGYARKSKNLLDCSGLSTISKNGVTITPKYAGDKLEYIHINGTASGTFQYSIKTFDKVGTFILSGAIGFLRNSAGGWVATVGDGDTFSIASGQYIEVLYYISSGDVYTNEYKYPMVRLASVTDATYEPYGIIKPSGIVESKSANIYNPSKLTVGSNISSLELGTDNWKITVGSGSNIILGNTDQGSTSVKSQTALNNMIKIDGKGGRYSFIGEQNRGKYIHLYDASGNTVKMNNANWNTPSVDTTYDIPIGVAYIGYNYTFVATPNEVLNLKPLMVCKGEVVPFVPYAHDSITLPYIPLGVGDIHDELIVNADGSGKYIKRIGTVDLGSLNWVKFTTQYVNNFVRYSADLPTKLEGYSNLLCGIYKVDTAPVDLKIEDMTICGYTSKTIYVQNYAYSDASAFKSAMNGIILYYELATEQTINLTASQVAQILELKTFADTTYIDADGMHYDIGYAQNSAKAIKELQNIIKNLLNPQTESQLEEVGHISALSIEEGEETNV